MSVMNPLSELLPLPIYASYQHAKDRDQNANFAARIEPHPDPG